MITLSMPNFVHILSICPPSRVTGDPTPRKGPLSNPVTFCHVVNRYNGVIP